MKKDKRSPTPVRKSERDVLREKEEEAEDKERKEQERKVRKKELQYQERLKNWETREHKKQKELDREKEKDKLKEIEREKEARRLKEFLEDYDDERDDPKYYKGHAFQRRLMEREQEKEMDTRDRVKEKEELEELRNKILAEGHDNPDAAFQKACAEREEQYRPKLLVKPTERKVPPSTPVSTTPPPVVSLTPEQQPPAQPMPQQPPPQPASTADSDSESDGHVSDAAPEPMPDMEENSQSRDGFMSSENTTPQQPKRKKLDVKDVFNQDDDDMPAKKKKLPLPERTLSAREDPLQKLLRNSAEPGKDKGSKEKGGGEEKRKHIKSMIDKIPTSKEELFAYPIDSSLVDNVLMEKRIRPWINKKIIEYIGEPEPTLVDFICSKVLVGSEPQSLLNDVQMVLDDEAEVFVVKMWRLLIYEIEAKKLAGTKS